VKENPAQRAADAAGGQSALARLIGCTPQAVQKMCATGHVPAERVLQIEAAVGAQVTRHELRPDLYPHEMDTAKDGGFDSCTDS
jgi:DNA-binding transcriptional regulator YdaS (Cro superfamily)